MASQRFFHQWWWQADGGRTGRGTGPPPPHHLSVRIKCHLHFMSLNCFCCPPPHRLCDFVPVTVRPCTLWRSCDRLRWTFCLGPTHCVPEIRKNYLPLGWRLKRVGGVWAAVGGEGDIGWDRTRQGKFFFSINGKGVLKARLWPHDGKAMCNPPDTDNNL